MDSAVIKNASGAAQSPSAVPPQMRKRYELLDECRELIVGVLSQSLTEAVQSLSEKLSTAAANAKDPKEQELMLAAASVVRSNRDEIAGKFDRGFKDIFERRLFATQATEESAADSVSLEDLHLVSEEDYSAKLSSEKLIHRAKSKINPDHVLGIRARFGALLEREWFEEDKQPASPSDVLDALRQSLGEVSPSPEVANALLEAFEPYISRNLNDAYDQVNQRLVAHQILPKIRPVVLRSNQQRAASGYNDGSSNPGSPAGHIEDQHAHFGRGAGIAAGSNSIDPMFMSAQTFHHLLESLQMGMPVARQQAVRMLTDESSFGLLDLPFPEPAQPLLDAVSHLQSQLFSAPMGGRQQLTDLKEQVTDKGSALDKLTVDIVELVFDYIYADHRLADPIKQRLLRLQVVAFKAALLDRSFFAKRQHPLRQVLDEITELGCDPDADCDPNSEFVQDIDSIVNRIVSDFESDMQVFTDALDSLAKVAEREEVRRQQWLEQKTAEGLVEEQRVDALDEFRRQMSLRVDHSAPDFLREFLYRWWSPVLANSRVVADAPIKEEQAMMLADSLLWSVLPKSPEEVPKLATLLPQLITGIIKGLGMVQCPQAERESFFNELLRIHTRAIDAAKAAPPALRPVVDGQSPLRPPNSFVLSDNGEVKFQQKNVPVEQPAAAAPTLSLRDAAIEMLIRGQRLDIMEDNGEVNRYKLAWISPSKKLYLLSRYPFEPLSVNRADLASWLESGKARPADQDSIIGKAIGAAINITPMKLDVAA